MHSGLEEREMSTETEKQIKKEARILCEKFIKKVENGRARSVETYNDCKTLLKLLDGEETLNADKGGS